MTKVSNRFSLSASKSIGSSPLGLSTGVMRFCFCCMLIMACMEGGGAWVAPPTAPGGRGPLCPMPMAGGPAPVAPCWELGGYPWLGGWPIELEGWGG